MAAVNNYAGTLGVKKGCPGQTGMGGHSAVPHSLINRVFLREIPQARA